MGTISKGILGGFSGKVGTVIGGSWKGIEYMRSQAARRSFNPSESQLAQQQKFALIMRFLQPMASLLSVSFHNFAVKMTGINNALAYNIQSAITGAYPAFSIDYSLALVSRGDLPNALSPAVTLGAANVLAFNWTDNTGAGIAKATDQAILVVYCPELRQCVYTMAGGTRSSATGDIDASQFAGQVVQTWIGFISENSQKVATSIFTGEVSLVI